LLAAGTGKTTPTGADSLAISDSAAAGATKTLTFTNLVTYLAGLCSAGWNAATATLATTATDATNATNATNATGSAVVTGLVQSGTNPKFGVYSGAFILTSVVAVKIPLAYSEFNVGGMFDIVTNYRFTPTVAGYYQFSWALNFNDASTSLTQAYSALYKNGALFKIGADYNSTATAQFGSTGGVLVYLNGTTDYIELYGYAVGTTPSISGSSANNYLTGTLIP